MKLRPSFADAQEVFLLDAVLPVAAVELMGDDAVELAVHVEVGIHQIELHAAHVHAPYVAIYYTSGIWHFENHGTAVLFEHLLDGQLIEVLGLVVGNLLAVDAERLCEVAVPVEETDGGHVHAAVRCFLDIVAGKNTESAGVDLEAVAQAVFHREVGYRGDIAAHGLLHILAEIGIDVIDGSHHDFVVENLLNSVAAEALDEHYRVLAGLPPQVGVDGAEEVLGLAVPNPPEVFGQLFEGFELGGKF